MAVSPPEPAAQQDGSSARLVIGVALRFGIGVGLVCVLWMVGLQLTGNNGFGPKQLLAQLLVPLVAVASEWWLRKQVKPDKPGLGRSLGVGMLTVLLAAVVSAGGVLALAAGAGEAVVARHRAEVLEILRVQQLEKAEVKLSDEQREQQTYYVQELSTRDIALDNFAKTLLLGLVLALPAGIFLRE